MYIQNLEKNNFHLDLFSHSTFLNSLSLYITPFQHEHSDLNATFFATEHSLKTDLPLKKSLKKKKKSQHFSLFRNSHGFKDVPNQPFPPQPIRLQDFSLNETEGG